MKHLFVCCDGTWNAPTDLHDGVPVPTNVVRTYNALAPTAPLSAGSVAQLRYYHPGIGAGATIWRRLWDGAFGSGIAEQIQSAYKFLADHFNPGDRVFLLGFSRGAYTVRSLAGMLNRVGLVDRASWPEVGAAYQIYRLGTTEAAHARLSRLKASVGSRLRDIPIDVIGVWDTVGALGIPIPRHVAWLLPGLRNNRFHDTTLSPHVLNAFQVLAIDERRASFSPTLWEESPPPATTQHVEQVWFPGVHSDVGGGYRETGLSDASLSWMLGKLLAAGAGLDASLTAQLKPDPLGVLHDSFRGFFALGGSQPRSIPSLQPGAGPPPPTQAISQTTRDRHACPPIAQAPYRETIRLASGQSISCTVYAREPWNWTGIFVEPNDVYDITASSSSSWKDAGIICDTRGYRRVWLAPFTRLRRVPAANWFCLCAAVANARNPAVSGIPARASTFVIGLSKRISTMRGGYLYLFANDIEFMYFNNRGSASVNIMRL